MRWMGLLAIVSGMRITGGTLCGRLVRVPKGDLRPTQDRVRESLFATLGRRVEAVRFMDLFAGSGAVGLEAWSRGAAHVCWVEQNRRSASVLRVNVEALCGTGEKIVVAEALRYLTRRADDAAYDIVFCDPPYRSGPAAKGGRTMDWAVAVMDALAAHDRLSPDGLLIMEEPADSAASQAEGWDEVDRRCYGGTRLRFFSPSRSS